MSRIWNNESDGGSYSINYYFFHFLINYNQKCGNALYNSKIYYNILNLKSKESIWRFYSNLYGFILYGDPSLGLFTEKNR